MDTTPEDSTLCPPHHWLIEETLHVQRWACYRCQTRRELPQERWISTSQFNSTRPRPTAPGPPPPIVMPAG
jgi:hypothetical protein